VLHKQVRVQVQVQVQAEVQVQVEVEVLELAVVLAGPWPGRVDLQVLVHPSQAVDVHRPKGGGQDSTKKQVQQGLAQHKQKQMHVCGKGRKKSVVWFLPRPVTQPVHPHEQLPLLTTGS